MMSTPLAAGARSAIVQREIGTSDHGPVIVDVEAKGAYP
jgi:hypothetical protein